MGTFIGIVGKELWNTVRRPLRIIHILNKERRKQILKSLKMRWWDVHIGKVWTPYDSGSSFKKRVYPSYEDYVEHQKLNLNDSQDVRLQKEEISQSMTIRIGVFCERGWPT